MFGKLKSSLLTANYYKKKNNKIKLKTKILKLHILSKIYKRPIAVASMVLI